MNLSLLYFGIVCFILIVGIWLMMSNDKETFESNTTIDSRVIDFASVIPDPITNPTKLVVVIGCEKYIWKYDIIPKKIDNMSDFEINNLGLKLILGYPKLIADEWSHLPAIFHSDLTGVFNPQKNLWIIKNSQWVSKNNYNGDKDSGELSNISWYANLKKIMDPNTIDTFQSHPDMCFGSGDRNIYLTNEYPNYSKTGSNTKNYVFNSVYTPTKQYIMTLPSNDWNNLKTNIWTDYNKSPLTKYTHAFNHLGLQTNSVDSIVYLNDLQNCLIKLGTNNKQVNDCNLWYHIRSKIRCVGVVAGYVYVLSRDKVWKYTPSGNNLLLESGYPCKFNEEWTNIGINDNISAIVSLGAHIMFFKDDYVVTYDVTNDSFLDKVPIKNLLPELGRIDTAYQNDNVVTFYCDDMAYTYNMANIPKLMTKNLVSGRFVVKYNNPITKNPVTIYKDYTDINRSKVPNSNLYHVCAKTLFVSNDTSEIIIYSPGMLNNVAFDGNMITGVGTGSGLYQIMQNMGLDSIAEVSGVLVIKNIIYIFQDNKVHLFNAADGSFVSTYNMSDIWKTIPCRCSLMFYDHNQYAWFFKDGMVYRMDINTTTIEIGKYTKYFEDLNDSVDSVFYHKASDILVFVHGVTYTYYKYNEGVCELIDVDLMMDTLIINTIKSKYLVFNVVSDDGNLSQKRMISTENYIPNGDFNDTTVLDNVGTTDGSKVVLSAARDTGGLPIVANVLKYSITSGNIFNIRTQLPNGMEDVMFSFYMRSDSPCAVNLKIMSKNNTSFKMINVTQNWNRFSIYHKHKTGALEITGYVESSNYVSVYTSGLLLENNVKPSMYFNGKAVVIQDRNTTNKYYAYNVKQMSSYPNTSMDLETLMSYRADNSSIMGDIQDTVAIKLDSRLTYIYIPVADLINVHNMSLTFWLKLREMKPCSIVKSDTLRLEFNNGKLKLITNGIDHTFSSIDFKINRWYFISLVFIGNKARLYAYNYYEEVTVPSGDLFTDNLYMGVGMSGDIGNLTLWNKSLLASDISKLSLTNKDVVIAAAQTSRHEVVTSGLIIPPVQPNVSNVSGLGNCTYNAKVMWSVPKLPQDYINIGYTVVKYEYYLEYYLPSGLVTTDQVDTYIATKALSTRVKDIKIIQTDTNNYIDLVNLPYNNNYRLSVRYLLSNAEMSDWARCDLFWDKIVKTFQLSGTNVLCRDETKIIDNQQKVIDENKQNNLIKYFKDRIAKF